MSKRPGFNHYFQRFVL